MEGLASEWGSWALWHPGERIIRNAQHERLGRRRSDLVKNELH